MHPIEGNDESSLRVVQWSLKPQTPDLSVALSHVIYVHKNAESTETLSLFRSPDLEEAIDFCRRCEECRGLFHLLGMYAVFLLTLAFATAILDNQRDIRKQLREMTRQIQLHPLWRMVHIAIACYRTDVFTDDALATLEQFGYIKDELVAFAHLISVKSNICMFVEFCCRGHRLKADIHFYSPSRPISRKSPSFCYESAPK